MKYTFIFTLILTVFNVSAQTFELVDEIIGGTDSEQLELKINTIGERFYFIGSSNDSIWINNRLLLKGEEVGGFPNNRSFIGVTREGVPKFDYPKGNVNIITDNSIIAFNYWGGGSNYDTLAILDTVLVNTVNENGGNLLLREYNFDGDLIYSKHWQADIDIAYSIGDAFFSNGKLYVVGTYSSIEHYLRLDNAILPLHISNGNVFIGQISDDFEFEWLRGFENFGLNYSSHIIINNKEEILVSVYAWESTGINVCGTHIASGVGGWGTSFSYMVQIDTLGQCIRSKVPDFSGSYIAITNGIAMSDGSYVLAGGYSTAYLGFDSLYLHAPYGGGGLPLGFLVRLSDTLEAQAVFQVDKGYQFSHNSIVSMDGENIWLCGISTSDTLHFGDFELLAGENNYISFIVKLNKNLEPLYAYQFDGERPEKLFKGQDENLYVLTKDMELRDKKLRLYRIKDKSSSPLTENTSIAINVFPNPIKDGTALEYKILPEDVVCHIKSIQVYTIDGKKVMSLEAEEGRTSISLPNLSAGMYIVEFLFDNGQQVSRKVVVME